MPDHRAAGRQAGREHFERLCASVPGAAPNGQSPLSDGQRGAGTADLRTPFIEQLNSPFGMALVGEDFYVANTDAVLRFPYVTGQQRIEARGTTLAQLPAGPRNHHWTRGLIASPDGARLYATVGSNSNVAEHGMAEEDGRAAIWEIDRTSGRHRIFASGLRDPNGLAWEPTSGALWTTG